MHPTKMERLEKEAFKLLNEYFNLNQSLSAESFRDVALEDHIVEQLAGMSNFSVFDIAVSDSGFS